MTNALGISGSFPPTIQQRGIIAMLANDSGGHVSHLVKLAYLVEPAINLRRLERSFAKLTARHDALRQSFERRTNTWIVNVCNRHRFGLVVEDHGDINDADFHALLEHHASIRIELLDEALFHAVVLKCGKRGDVLFLRFHHAVVDADSTIILTEDWLKLLIGVPLSGRGVTHEEFLAEQSNLSSQQKKENKNYWSQLLFPALPDPGLGKFGNSGKRPRLIYRTDTIRSIKCSLTSDELNKIPIVVNAGSQTTFSIVLAAFAKTIVELSDLPGIYISTNVARTSNRLRNYVGCAILWPPLRCNASDDISLAEYSTALALQWKHSLSHLPGEAATFESDFDLAVDKAGGVLRHFHCTAGFTGARLENSPFSSGILTASEAPRQFGPLTVTRLKIPPFSHNINGIKMRIDFGVDRSEIEFTYHKHLYTEKDMQMLLSGMQDKLRTRLI